MPWYFWIIGIGGWVCFIAASILAALKLYILNEGWNEEMQRAQALLAQAEKDVRGWQNKYRDLKLEIEREKMAEKEAKKIVGGNGE